MESRALPSTSAAQSAPLYTDTGPEPTPKPDALHSPRSCQSLFSAYRFREVSLKKSWLLLTAELASTDLFLPHRTVGTLNVDEHTVGRTGRPRKKRRYRTIVSLLTSDSENIAGTKATNGGFFHFERHRPDDLGLIRQQLGRRLLPGICGQPHFFR